MMEELDDVFAIATTFSFSNKSPIVEDLHHASFLFSV